MIDKEPIIIEKIINNFVKLLNSIVISPLEGSPASDAGITSGTILKKVNGQSPKQLGLEATAAKLSGQTGTQVIVELQQPDDEIKEISLERRSVDLRPVRTKRIRNESHTFGYLRITQFSETVLCKSRKHWKSYLAKK